MFDDFDYGGGHDGDHGGGGVDDDVALVARRPKQQCGSDDSSSTSGLPESHFPPFVLLNYVSFNILFSVLFHISSLCTLAKAIPTGFTCRIISKRILTVFNHWSQNNLLIIHLFKSISSLSTSSIPTTFLTMIRLHLNGAV